MAYRVLLALALGSTFLAEGFRQQVQHQLISEDSESVVNEAADTNTKAFAEVGICHGKAAPPQCCCAPAANAGQCQGEGFYFYPGVRSRDKGAFSSRTCSATGFCCKTASSGKCPAKSVTVVVKEGENIGKQAKAYVKVYVAGFERKTDPCSGSGACKWNQILTFSRTGRITLEVKYKRAFGAGSYGVVEVPNAIKFWEPGVQVVEVQVPKFGKVTLEVSAPPGTGVDDDFDTSLCSGTPSALLQQSLAGSPEESLDDFLAMLEKEAPTETKLNKDTPAFLNVLAHKPNQLASSKFMTRDYTLIIDRSGSMSRRDSVHVPTKTAGKLGKSEGIHSLSRWEQVSGALQYLVPYVVAEDPDGIGVYFFDTKWDEAPNVCAENEVTRLFRQNNPGGITNLGGVLKEAMEPDTVGRAETIFILTDGGASDPDVVSRNIIEYTKKMCRPEMLSISFIQVGTDRSAQDYLESLDNTLESRGAKFDIVDAMTKDEMHGRSFMDIVELSVTD